MEKSENDQEKIVTTNRKARHDYEIISVVEAGISLLGSEVKSLRLGNANLQDSYAAVVNGEVILSGMHVSPYEHATVTSHDPRRDRRLLLHKKEIRKFIGKTTEKGLTLIPLKIYFKRGRAKVALALCRGKRQYDKREAIKKKENEREMNRARSQRS